jgi:hypothetical protein
MTDVDREAETETIADGGVRSGDIIRDSLGAYGRKVLANHLPNDVSGLKLLYMRAVWAAAAFPKTGTKSLSAIGAVKAYHDHSGESIYDALSRMAQDFVTSPPLLKMEGSVGTIMEPKAANAKYTEMSMAPFCQDLFYTGIDQRAIPKRPGMDPQLYEPQYLAAAIPTALYFGVITIGYGHGARIPGRNLGDICTLAARYCEHQDHGTGIFLAQNHPELLLPDWACGGSITNAPELLAEYAKGNYAAPIEVEGKARLSKDRISIYELPTGRQLSVADDLQALLNRISAGKAATESEQWLDRHIADVYNDTDCAVITLKRTGVTVFEVWEKLRRTIRFNDTFYPNANYVDSDGEFAPRSPDTLLALWFSKRHALLMATKRQRYKQLAQDLSIVKAQIIATTDTDLVLDIVRKRSNTPEAAIEQLMEAFKDRQLTHAQARYLISVQIQSLTRAKTEDLEKRRDEILEKIRETQEAFANIPQEMADTARSIRARYTPAERGTKLPRYTGHASIGDYCIQVETPADVEMIIEDFPGVPLEIHTYDGDNIVNVGLNGRFGSLSTSQSRYVEGDLFGLPCTAEDGYTVVIHEDRKACCVEGIVPGRRSNGYFYTTKDSIVICQKSRAAWAVNVTEAFSMRKKIGQGARTPYTYVYPNPQRVHYLLFASSTEPNMLTVQRVNPDEMTPVYLPPEGSLYLEHHLSSNDWYFSLPDHCTNRLNVRVFYIPNVEALLGDQPRVRIDLGSTKVKGRSAIKYLT